MRRSIAAAAHRPGRGWVIVAIADLDSDVRKREAERFNTDIAVENHRQLLERGDLDAVIVATPDDSHGAIACDMLRAGVPAFVEKPLGITVEQCDTILSTAYETGTRLYVGHNMRQTGVVRLMRDIIARGDTGEPKAVWVRHFVGYGGDYYFKDWHADRSRTNGLLLQKAPQDINVQHWLAGGYTSRVNALGDLLVYGDLPRREPDTPRPEGWLRDFDWPPTAQRDLHHVVDVEDVSVMNMQLDNGVTAAYQQCHFTPDYWRNYTVIGTEGRLENFGDDPGDTVKVWNSGPSGYRADADISYRVPNADGSHGGGDSRITAEFCRFIRQGGATDTSPVAARMSVAAGALATRSLREGGRPYDVPALDPELVAYFERGQVP
ncbi:Gfo/Idh/MocA family oxidoreductase [Streptomyces sp. NPDC005706]|uniref:Gfo/Idh/MocA family protein n=1 Tax=Streptomyces sp. NPDC005706 TaxID=3157169 RepID=UPI0033CA3DD9